MTFATWLTFFIATILLCFSPGPGALSSMSAGMKYGWKRGMWNCIGMQVSIMVNVTIIALGLGALLMASNTAFEVMKWCGALYLMWLLLDKYSSMRHEKLLNRFPAFLRIRLQKKMRASNFFHLRIGAGALDESIKRYQTILRWLKNQNRQLGFVQERVQISG